MSRFKPETSAQLNQNPLRKRSLNQAILIMLISLGSFFPTKARAQLCKEILGYSSVALVTRETWQDEGSADPSARVVKLYSFTEEFDRDRDLFELLQKIGFHRNSENLIFKVPAIEFIPRERKMIIENIQGHTLHDLIIGNPNGAQTLELKEKFIKGIREINQVFTTQNFEFFMENEQQEKIKGYFRDRKDDGLPVVTFMSSFFSKEKFDMIIKSDNIIVDERGHFWIIDPY